MVAEWLASWGLQWFARIANVSGLSIPRVVGADPPRLGNTKMKWSSIDVRSAKAKIWLQHQSMRRSLRSEESRRPENNVQNVGRALSQRSILESGIDGRCSEGGLEALASHRLQSIASVDPGPSGPETLNMPSPGFGLWTDEEFTPTGPIEVRDGRWTSSAKLAFLGCGLALDPGLSGKQNSIATSLRS